MTPRSSEACLGESNDAGARCFCENLRSYLLGSDFTGETFNVFPAGMLHQAFVAGGASSTQPAAAGKS